MKSTAFQTATPKALCSSYMVWVQYSCDKHAAFRCKYLNGARHPLPLPLLRQLFDQVLSQNFCMPKRLGISATAHILLPSFCWLSISSSENPAGYTQHILNIREVGVQCDQAPHSPMVSASYLLGSEPRPVQSQGCLNTLLARQKAFPDLYLMPVITTAKWTPREGVPTW